MDVLPAILCLLALHAVLGAVDTFVFHEWLERLPARPSAASELALHSLRSLFFVVIFYGLAWYQWHGAFGWLMVALSLIEYAVTIDDSIVEDRTRRLSPWERTNHMLLALNTGLYTGLLALHVATRWGHEPTAIVPIRHLPLLAGVLTVAAIGVAVWAVRDGVAALRLRSAERRSRPGPGVSGRV
jgi:hypothetical protein